MMVIKKRVYFAVGLFEVIMVNFGTTQGSVFSHFLCLTIQEAIIRGLFSVNRHLPNQYILLNLRKCVVMT